VYFLKKGFAMITSSNPSHDSMPDWYDPFAEPNTIPAGWDVSDLISKKADAPLDEEKASAGGTNELPSRVLLSLN